MGVTDPFEPTIAEGEEFGPLMDRFQAGLPTVLSQHVALGPGQVCQPCGAAQSSWLGRRPIGRRPRSSNRPEHCPSPSMLTPKSEASERRLLLAAMPRIVDF